MPGKLARLEARRGARSRAPQKKKHGITQFRHLRAVFVEGAYIRSRDAAWQGSMARVLLQLTIIDNGSNCPLVQCPPRGRDDRARIEPIGAVEIGNVPGLSERTNPKG